MCSQLRILLFIINFTIIIFFPVCAADNSIKLLDRSKGRSLLTNSNSNGNLTSIETALDDVSMEEDIGPCKEGSTVERGCEEVCSCVKGKLDCKPRCTGALVRPMMTPTDPHCIYRPTEDKCCSTLVCSNTDNDAASEGRGCVYKNETYTSGQTFYDDCTSTCSCNDGEVSCKPRCTAYNRTANFDRCLTLPDTKDPCCTILYCDVNASDDIGGDEDRMEIKLVSAVPANSTSLSLNLDSKNQIDQIDAEISKDQTNWTKIKSKGQTVTGLEPGNTYYLRVLNDGVPSNVVSATLPKISSDPSVCLYKEKSYKIGEEFHDDCKAYCQCLTSGVECFLIDCPSDFGLDVLDPQCVSWGSPPEFVPSPPNCCPESLICKNNGSCIYQGDRFENWADIPDKLTGCGEKCFCSNGNVTCRPRCSPVPPNPPYTLNCLPTMAILEHIPGDNCCLHWICPPANGTLPQGTTNTTTDKETENTTSTAAISPITNTIPAQYLGPYAPDLISKHLNTTDPKPPKDTVSRPHATNTTQDSAIKKKKTDREKDKDSKNSSDKKQPLLPSITKPNNEHADTNTDQLISNHDVNKHIDLDQFTQYHKFMLDKPSPLFPQHNQIINVANNFPPINHPLGNVSPNITYEIHEFPVKPYIPQPPLVPTNKYFPQPPTHKHPNFNSHQLIFQQHPQFPEELHIVRDNQHTPLGLEDIIEQIHHQASGSPSTTDSRTKYTHVIHLQAHPGLPSQGASSTHPITGYPSYADHDGSGITVHTLEAIDENTVRLVFSVPSVLVGLHGRVELRYTSDNKNSDPSRWEQQVLAPPNDLIATKDLEFELGNLQPATEYKIRITIVMRDLDNSPASQILFVKTPPAVSTTVPPMIPVEPELRVSSVNSTWATIEWRKFTENELQFIDGVQLRYKEVNGKVYQATPLIHRAVTSYTIEELKPDSQYEVGIFFIPFPGQTTELQSQTTVKLSTPIENDPYKFDLNLDVHHIKSTSVETTWSGVPYPVDKYINIIRIIYQDEGGRGDMSTFKVAKRDSPPESVIEGLKPETRYRLWLEAYLTNGRIKKSNVKDFTTKTGPSTGSVLHQGKLEGSGAGETANYYGALVGVSVVAGLASLAALGLVVALARNQSHHKAPISGQSQRNKAPHTAAYDNPSYKVDLHHETIDL